MAKNVRPSWIRYSDSLQPQVTNVAFLDLRASQYVKKMVACIKRRVRYSTLSPWTIMSTPQFVPRVGLCSQFYHNYKNGHCHGISIGTLVKSSI